tara:strand:+ start:283 stop:459 length:177 start_codon:yes stop_codon:yes gene_type:complete
MAVYQAAPKNDSGRDDEILEQLKKLVSVEQETAIGMQKAGFDEIDVEKVLADADEGEL